ncbi:hypothetical protein ABZ733_21755 [Streptomyces longwoodensis]|uniref:hypothetical protein n=1 Tax=Streptomyces longwoodensis TaxID=68231 RepID=UPI0033DC1597
MVRHLGRDPDVLAVTRPSAAGRGAPPPRRPDDRRGTPDRGGGRCGPRRRPSPLASGTVTATLPAGATATSGSCTAAGSRVTCTVGALAPGATDTRTFAVPLGALTVGLPYTVTVQRTASSPADPDPSDDTASRTCTVITSLIVTCG